MKNLFTIAFACFALHAGAQVKWPAVTQQAKPWTRWWWEGSAVNAKDLTKNLEQYKAAGLGGVELTPIYGVYGHEKQFLDFLSPKWMQMLMHTLKEAQRLGIGVDLANGTGWPFGGPWVTDANASKSVFYKTYTLNEGGVLNEAIEYKRDALVRTANNKPAAIDTILKPVYINKNLQALALDQIVYPGNLPLQLLMAYSDDGEMTDLTKNVDAAGKLNWTAPKGKWTLYALFTGLHGKMVERAAPGGEGYAIDHFSAKASADYFKRFDEAFKGYNISYLRAFFNDSYEVDDARGQSNWTPAFFDEFKKRKGYELKNHLNALFGKSDADMNSRVLYDYRSVIDELLLEHFTVAWKKWATTKGAMVRNQSHGSPANTLDLYSAVDIPETEGENILRFKFATSAANVTGKPLASSESATWLNEHFLSSWGDVKKMIDQFFIGGVNHIFYHGTAYSPAEAPWPGWLFYAAVHFQQTNPQWKDFKTLNDYIARVQSFLQTGRPDNDVLVYYPIIDRYSQTGGELLQHFDGMERNFTNTDFEHASQWMLDNDYTFDFFSDRQLQKMSVSTGRILSGGNKYQTILLPASKLISEKTLQKLVELAKGGAHIVVYKSMPVDVPGFAQLEERRKLFRQLNGQLKFESEGKLSKAVIGNGAFYITDDLQAALALRTTKESFAANGLQFTRRKDSADVIYFVTNKSSNAFDGLVPLRGYMGRVSRDGRTLRLSPASIALFNPMTGNSGLAEWNFIANTYTTQARLQLQPFESIIIRVYNDKVTGPRYPYLERSGSPITLTGQWTVEFLSGGPVLPAKRTISKLGSWTEFDGQEVKDFSGISKYSIAFQKPASGATAWLLDLGKVHETAEVFINGKKHATLIGPSYQTVIPSSLLKESNTLEVVVANLMANRIAYMDRNNIPWKIFYNTNMPARRRENAKNGIFTAADWKPMPSGLMGDVTLTPIKN